MDDAPEVTSSATGTANEENSDLAIYTATASDVESEAITLRLVVPMQACLRLIRVRVL